MSVAWFILYASPGRFPFWVVTVSPVTVNAAWIYDEGTLAHRLSEWTRKIFTFRWVFMMNADMKLVCDWKKKNVVMTEHDNSECQEEGTAVWHYHITFKHFDENCFRLNWREKESLKLIFILLLLLCEHKDDKVSSFCTYLHNHRW